MMHSVRVEIAAGRIVRAWTNWAEVVLEVFDADQRAGYVVRAEYTPDLAEKGERELPWHK